MSSGEGVAGGEDGAARTRDVMCDTERGDGVIESRAADEERDEEDEQPHENVSPLLAVVVMMMSVYRCGAGYHGSITGG